MKSYVIAGPASDKYFHGKDALPIGFDGRTMDTYFADDSAAIAWWSASSVDMREVINGILYLNRTGCAWRQLPHDLPPWGTLHFFYRRFRLDGVWAKIHDRLREKVRQSVARSRPLPPPSSTASR